MYPQIIRHNFKLIGHSFTANWKLFMIYPRFWLNKSIKTPSLYHWSFVIRFAWWYFGIERKRPPVKYSLEDTYYYNINRDKPELNRNL